MKRFQALLIAACFRDRDRRVCRRSDDNSCSGHAGAGDDSAPAQKPRDQAEVRGEEGEERHGHGEVGVR